MPNRKTHTSVGIAAGGGLAMYLSRKQKGSHQAIETLGGALSGSFFGKLPDIIEPAYHPRHRSFAHSALLNTGLSGVGINKLGSWQKSLRNEAQHQCMLKEQASDEVSRYWHSFLEILFRLLAGAVAGAFAGYESHILLDAFTPLSLPVIK